MGLVQFQVMTPSLNGHSDRHCWLYTHVFIHFSSKAAGVAADQPCKAAFYQVFSINIEQEGNHSVPLHPVVQSLKVTIKVQ